EIERVVVEEPLIVEQHVSVLKGKEYGQFNSLVSKRVRQAAEPRRIPRSEFCYSVIRIVNVSYVAILVAVQGITIGGIHPGPFHHGERADGKTFAESRLACGVVLESQL